MGAKLGGGTGRVIDRSGGCPKQNESKWGIGLIGFYVRVPAPHGNGKQGEVETFFEEEPRKEGGGGRYLP